MNRSQITREASGTEILTEVQKERFDTLRRVLRVQIDGDWDETMIRTAFENLEKLLFEMSGEGGPDDGEETKPSRGKSRSSSGKRKSKKN
jgi:hypothetical protein